MKSALTVLLIPAAVAWGADGRHCLSIEDDTARLACYDAAYGRGGNDPAPAAAAVTATSTAVTVDPEAEFGLSEAQKRVQNPERARDVPPDSITSGVAAVGQTPSGGLLVTLENGQVWAQAETLTKARVAAGDEVTIKKATLGSYMMLAPNKVAVRVRRVR
jgi:hypothetical protein